MIEEDIPVSGECDLGDARKTRVAAVGVAELMKTFKPKKKGPIDKGKRQGKTDSTSLRGQSSTLSC